MIQKYRADLDIADNGDINPKITKYKNGNLVLFVDHVEALAKQKADIVSLLEGMKGTHNGTNVEMIAWGIKNQTINEILSKITAKE